MPIRITGMNSGLDTESIIAELVNAQKTKVDGVRKKQTAHQWKQDIWKGLNSRIYKLFNGTVSNMRYATDYGKKTTDISNPSIANIVTGDSAMNSTQKLLVKKLASSGYMTGAQINGDITSGSKLTDMGIAADSTITVTTGGKATDIKITEGMTVKGFVDALNNAGVKASFDEKNKRFHIASMDSGAENDFTITAANDGGTDALDKLGMLLYDENTIKEYDKLATMTEDEIDAAVDADVAKRLKAYISQRESLLKSLEKQTEDQNKTQSAFETEYPGETIEAALANIDDLKTEIEGLKGDIETAGDAATDEDKEKLAKLKSKLSQVEKYEKQKKGIGDTKTLLGEVNSYLDTTGDPITANNELTGEVEGIWAEKIRRAQEIIDNSGSLPTNPDIHKNNGQDAEIVLNGVTYKGTSNTFEVNGLTITALMESAEEVTLTTRQDTDGIYDMIKNFLKEYNAVIIEMDKLYNADATKGYEPLTDEQKKEMSDSEIEKWEDKIKDSILRGDSNLSTISSAMKNIMLQGVDVNGEKMYLSNFGVETLGYFTSEENERSAFHINGDPDDSAVSSKENTLKASIANDPDSVIGFFSGMVDNLYKELNNQSKSVEGIRTFGTFYDDKKMKDDYTKFGEKIKKQEERLKAMEDRWYQKFSAMETALAKMQSNQSAVSSLLGG